MWIFRSITCLNYISGRSVSASGRRGEFAVSSCGEPQGESKNDKRKRKSQQIHCGGTSAPAYAAGRTDSLCRRIFWAGRTWKAASEKDGVFFNLSHAGAYAVGALSDVPVGVDVEQQNRFGRKPAIRSWQSGY